jgi:multidrug efflux pump subunit AcrA (membrane-fusion protein)
VVIVALGDGRFAPRDVRLGPEGDGFVQVLDGLSDGEEIVTSSQFLIDSESNLREAIQTMIAAKRAGGGQ